MAEHIMYVKRILKNNPSNFSLAFLLPHTICYSSMTQHVKNKFPMCGEKAFKSGEGHRASVWLTPADLKLVRSLQKRLSTRLTRPGLTEIMRKALEALDADLAASVARSELTENDSAVA